ncbi:rho GTPase-activating protein 32-like isoform X1 [Prorops nasuta]|uniref:rho GTPase-activating protein 32-like isoform X1 n=2 Tax=Prorops nasuta TaxID=863751 RepID=UPI0034CE620E
MPGPTADRPRAHRLTDIEPQTAKQLGRNVGDAFGTPVSSGSNMCSIARFPKLDECAHFHYEHVELGTLEVTISYGSNDSDTYAVRVTSGDACWTLQRSYDNFVMFDKQLHRCIFDRKFSGLAKLPDARPNNTCDLLRDYLRRFTQLNHEGLNCGPVLNWLQLDNRGRRILVPESDSYPINTPAVAAAYAVRPYLGKAWDEISFMVGDMISVIDMPPPEESTWWRGKLGFAVGFFPADRVAVIGDKVPRHLTAFNSVQSKLPVKPVLRKHGKLIAFFRSFILNRPSRRRLKQSGILKERVFGCDLGEHLLNSGQDVPTVLTCCAEFIESHGLVDGIYRLSGVTSNIQRLRNAFDEDRVPALHSDESILQDIHSVASLLKMYFRELPNPLCTYQLYSTFVSAVQASTDAERLRRMRDAVRKLPPPHYRTLEYLMRHLVRVAARGSETGMTPRNVAIVWAPNLLRCKELEVGGVAALQGVGVQAVVTEFLVCYAELIFGDGPVGRPKSLAITTPARLLSLEEARNRILRGEPDYIEVGAGTSGLPLQYHTVIELPRKRTGGGSGSGSGSGSGGSKRSPSLNWRALFGRGGSGARGKARQVGATTAQADAVPSSLNSLRRLRPVKSADSLDGEDSLGPLLGSPPARACGHSRSVSHDSYFDHLAAAAATAAAAAAADADAPSTASPLDLSEIQLNFDLEEREMRMFSEEESGGVGSVEASPRRQRSDTIQSNPTTGGSKRKRSRLEERLHCDVELRFIDSQSPDQVMVSADIHNLVETPSPLPTPGYLPLLSEASTPLTPATLQGGAASHSVSPITSSSPRISFRSFTLPLELDFDQSNSSKLNRISVSSEKTANPSHRLSVNLDEQQTNSKSCERIRTYDRHEPYDTKDPSKLSANPSSAGFPEVQDQGMTPCKRLLLSPCSDIDIDVDSGKLVPSPPCNDQAPLGTEETRNSGKSQETDDGGKREALDGESPASQHQRLANRSNNNSRGVDPALAGSSNTDMDSPMSCEHTLEDLPDSGFVICDSSDKMFSNTETPQITTNTNDSGDWVIVERTTASITTPNSDSNSPKDELEGTVNPAIATDTPQLRSRSENMSRTSLDLTMGSTIDTDTSCIGTSDLTESPVLLQESNELAFDPVDSSRCCGKEFNAAEECGAAASAAPTNHDPGSMIIRKTTASILGGAEDIGKGDTNESDFDKENEMEVPKSRANRASENQRIDRTAHDPSKDRSVESERLKEKCQSFENRSSSKNNGQAECSLRRTDEQICQKSLMDDSSKNLAAGTTEASKSSGDASMEESIVLRDTAAILQELALQRLSGGLVKDYYPAPRRKEAAEIRDRKSFDSESARDVARERKIRQELDSASRPATTTTTAAAAAAAEKTEEPNSTVVSHLPPCVRARYARATRAALSRSLDEAKFKQMAGDCGGSSLRVKSSPDESHSSTPNVGADTSSGNGLERTYLRNLGGLDLGDPQCRERIEKYKEERRIFLRDKYRSESFRGVASRVEDDGEQALLARLKQRASRPTLH